MGRAISLIVTLTLVALSGIRLNAQTTTQPDLTSENARLRTRVRELEERVRELEHQLDQKSPHYGEPFSLVPMPPPKQPAPGFPYRFVGRPYPFANPVELNVQGNGYLQELPGWVREPRNDLIDDRPHTSVKSH